MKLVIDFCTDCGHVEKAVESVREILEDYPDDFDTAELVPAEDGVFRISIDSEVIFDIDEEDFSVHKINEKVEEHIQDTEE